MQLISTVATYPAPNGCRIIRPNDRSCWLLRLPNGRMMGGTFDTRKAAESAAAKVRNPAD